MFGEEEKQIVFIGSDHAGFQAKAKLGEFLKGEGYEVTDLGCFSEEACDYPDIAREVSEKVLEHEGMFGVLLCGTGIGMSMAANRLNGIRAVLATSEELAEMGRKHNNANVLTMGARTTDLELMKKITMKFLRTEFDSSAERHVKRVAKMG
jgi:ribose 5-phosphate isomerase B